MDDDSRMYDWKYYAKEGELGKQQILIAVGINEKNRRMNFLSNLEKRKI